jgi:hypothetical protein
MWKKYNNAVKIIIQEQKPTNPNQFVELVLVLILYVFVASMGIQNLLPIPDYQPKNPFSSKMMTQVSLPE